MYANNVDVFDDICSVSPSDSKPESKCALLSFINKKAVIQGPQL